MNPINAIARLWLYWSQLQRRWRFRKPRSTNGANYVWVVSVGVRFINQNAARHGEVLALAASKDANGEAAQLDN